MIRIAEAFPDAEDVSALRMSNAAGGLITLGAARVSLAAACVPAGRYALFAALQCRTLKDGKIRHPAKSDTHTFPDVGILDFRTCFLARESGVRADTVT